MRYYCRLLTIRHTYPAIARGKYTSVDGEKNLGGFIIEYEGDSILLLHNTGTEELSYDLSKLPDAQKETFSKILEAVGQGAAKLDGDILTVSGQTSVLVG